MNHSRLNKTFGVGPKGALISLALFGMVAWIDCILGHPVVLLNIRLLRFFGVISVLMGLGLHLWSFWTLRNWWIKDRLCTMGPFKYFRHPMYAAWITFIALGVALYLNSWIFLSWVVLLHPIWHRLVIHEESMMLDRFGEDYRIFAAQTRRFLPRLLSR